MLNKIHNRLLRLKRDTKYIIYSKRIPPIENSIETIKYIIENRCSVSRFGDGEFSVMYNSQSNGFQEYTPQLAKRLYEVVNSNVNNHIVCIPYSLKDTSNIYDYAAKFWKDYIDFNHNKLLDSLKLDHYYDSLISRFYNDYVDKSLCDEQIKLLKNIWEDRDILIIEGDKTRSGVGNDLFDKTKSIRRVLAPAENAFSRYDEILHAAKENVHKDNLILISLGMTATVLAYDLAKCGFQAIDLGHLDLEYEWYNMKATRRVNLKNKYVNEAVDAGGSEVEECEDSQYITQIITRIE